MNKEYEMATVCNYVRTLDELLEGKEEAIIASVEEYLEYVDNSNRAQFFDLVV